MEFFKTELGIEFGEAFCAEKDHRNCGARIRKMIEKVGILGDFLKIWEILKKRAKVFFELGDPYFLLRFGSVFIGTLVNFKASV